MVFPKCAVSRCAAGNTSSLQPANTTPPPPPLPPLWCITPLTHFQSLLSPSLPGFILIWIHLFPIDLPLHPLPHWTNTRTHTVCTQALHTHSNREKIPIYNTVILEPRWRSICTPIHCRQDTPEIPHSSCERFQGLETRRFWEVSAQASNKLMTYKGTWIPYWSNTSGGGVWKHEQSGAGSGRQHNYSCSSFLRSAQFYSRIISTPNERNSVCCQLFREKCELGHQWWEWLCVSRRYFLQYSDSKNWKNNSTKFKIHVPKLCGKENRQLKKGYIVLKQKPKKNFHYRQIKFTIITCEYIKRIKLVFCPICITKSHIKAKINSWGTFQPKIQPSCMLQGIPVLTQ